MRATHTSRLAAGSTSAYSLGGLCGALSATLALQENADGVVVDYLTGRRFFRTVGSELAGALRCRFRAARRMQSEVTGLH